MMHTTLRVFALAAAVLSFAVVAQAKNPMLGARRCTKTEHIVCTAVI